MKWFWFSKQSGNWSLERANACYVRLKTLISCTLTLLSSVADDEHTQNTEVICGAQLCLNARAALVLQVIRQVASACVLPGQATISSQLTCVPLPISISRRREECECRSPFLPKPLTISGSCAHVSPKSILKLFLMPKHRFHSVWVTASNMQQP